MTWPLASTAFDSLGGVADAQIGAQEQEIVRGEVFDRVALPASGEVETELLPENRTVM